MSRCVTGTITLCQITKHILYKTTTGRLQDYVRTIKRDVYSSKKGHSMSFVFIQVVEAR
jgi:hypothetical protein